MSNMDLRIGIENEMFLNGPGSPPPDLVDKGQIETYVNDHLLDFYNDKKHGKALLREDFSHGSHPGHHNSHNNTGQWTVTTDDTIGELDLSSDAVGVKGWALEFVSPILEFKEGGTWRGEVKNHWAKLLDFGKVRIDNECATHVHISPEVGKEWTLMQLKAVARAVLYFEEVFKAIVAPSRRKHKHTKFNKASNRRLQNADFELCCMLIGECVNVEELVSLMQPPDSVNINAGPDRHYAWNFQNAMDGKLGTIEFRCAPGVETAEECLIWVELGALFVRKAALCGTKIIPGYEYTATVEGLHKFIHSAHFESMDDSGFWEIPFHCYYDSGAPLKSDQEMRDVFAEEIEILEF